MKSIHFCVSLPLLAALLILQAQSVLSQGLEIEVAPVPLIFPENVETEAAPKQVPFIETQEAGGVLVLALLGSALAVMSNISPPPVDQSNSRIDYEDPAVTYARNVAAFEHKVEKKIKNGVAAARNGVRKASRVLRNRVQNTARSGFGVVRSGANGMARIGDRAMRTFARATTNGFRRLGGATYNGVERAGNGAGSGIARVGMSARRGISRMTEAYSRSLARAGLGIIGVGSSAGRRLSNVAKTYMRGISRLGTAASRATSRMGSSSSVSRMGELAVDEVSKVAVEGASKVAEVATSVPKSLSNLANDKKIQDCFMQTMCYVSSPFLTGDRTQRKRMLRSLASISASSDENVTLSDEDDVTLLHTRQNNAIDDNIDVKMEDCDVFKCEIVSLGRKAYGIVSELREAATRR